MSLVETLDIFTPRCRFWKGLPNNGLLGSYDDLTRTPRERGPEKGDRGVALLMMVAVTVVETLLGTAVYEIGIFGSNIGRIGWRPMLFLSVSIKYLSLLFTS